MSLWNKPVNEITANDVDVFCKLGLPEEVRLDYKLEPPDQKLVKLVAAFANTLGGLIILGVDADKTTNKPIWPPADGMPTAPGIEEQITALCRANIYPPVAPLLSRVLDNPYLSGKSLVIVRVDESRDAPHTINNGRRVYERVMSQNDHCDFAHIDRIQHLLNRRQRIEEERERYVNLAIERSTERLHESFDGVYPATRWVSVIPLFPWQELCSLSSCRQATEVWVQANNFGNNRQWESQQVPGGTFSLGRSEFEADQKFVTASRGLSVRGHVFGLEQTLETIQEAASEQHVTKRKPTDYWIDYQKTRSFFCSILDYAAKFYQRPEVRVPGYLSISIGLLSVKGKRMFPPDGAKGRRFLDREFRADWIVHADPFLKEPRNEVAPLFHQLAYGFDLRLDQLKEI